MSEYVDKQALLDTLPSVKEDMQISLYGAVADFIIKVNAIPAADVEPVKHGHWTETVIPGEVPDYDCVCSLCGKSGLPIYNFCPNCGAKMDKEKK